MKEKEVERLNDDAEFREFLSEERETELLKNTLISEAHEEGLQQGKQEGEKQGIIMTAKNLLKLNISIADISKATGLSIEEINNLK